MPGSPPTTPNFGAPRYADSDDATFSTQVNSVADTFDALAVRNDDPRLSDTRTPSPGSVTAGTIPNASITGAKLAAQTITEAQLAPLSVGMPELIDAAVTTAKLAAGAVTTAALAVGAVATPSLADGAITPVKLAPAVTQAIAQPGFLQESAAAVAPAGWLVCDGSQVSRTLYAALFAAIGTAWGAGDGSTTFTLPDLRGRCMVGAGQGAGLTARGFGVLGGAETYRLAAADLPGHTHGYSGTTGADSPDHGHSTTMDGIPVYNTSQGGSVTFAGGSNSFQRNNFIVGGATARHAHSFGGTTDGGTGGGNAHPIMQPYGVVTILIKT